MDEFAHLDRFDERLRSNKVWKAIINEIRKARSQLASDDGGWLDGKPFEEANLQNRIHFDLYRVFGINSLERVFANQMLTGIAFPPVTATELAELAIQHLAGASSNIEFHVAVERLTSFADDLTKGRVEDWHLGERIPFENIPGIANEELNRLQRDGATIWTSQYGFWVTLRYSTFIPISPIEFNAAGKFSEEAMKNIDSALKKAVRSISTSLVLINSNPSKPDENNTIPFEYDEEGIATDLVQLEKSFFSQLLTYYFLPQEKKTNSFSQRLRNAMHLLVAADEQSNRVISHSLCFSAIESMLCQNVNGSSRELREHVAFLLQPNASARINAIEELKRLYEVRCKVIHGESMGGTNKDYWKIRSIAACVLKATTEWLAYKDRVGHEIEREEFISELRIISTTSGQMVGIDPKHSRFLPE